MLEDEIQQERKGNVGKNRTRLIEIRQKRSDGSTVWVEMNLRFLRDQGREVIGILGITRDIEARKKIEAEMQEKIETLEKFNRVMVARELKMIELKKEINALRSEMGTPAKYSIPEEEDF